MQQKLLSLAIAGALAIPGAAMADVTSDGGVTIYGKFHASYDVVDNGAVGDDTDDNTAAFRNTRLGFKGSEDIGGGLKGIWQVETKLDNNDDNVSLRNTFVGLEGDNWGRIFLGKHDTPYKMATAKLDIFSDTIADYNNIIGAHIVNAAGLMALNFEERENQVAAYVTPNFNGFEGAVARVSYQADEEIADPDADEIEAWSVMGKYDQGPFFASLAYELHSGFNNSGATLIDEIDAWKLGLGYNFGDSKIGFVYEDIDSDTNDSPKSRNAYWGSFAHKFGANEVKLAYGKADDSEANNTEDGADTWAVGLDHNFSKRTKIYAIYTHMDNDADAGYGLYTGDNGGDGRTPGFYTSDVAGSDLDAFSVGIIHKF